MAIKFLAVSDLHLGEAPSLVNSDAGLAHFADQLAGIVGKQEVETVVLVGDIVDQAMSSSTCYETRSRAFFRALFAAIPKPGKVVFLFGNHDLNLFRKLFCEGEPHSKFFVSGVKEKGNPAVGELRTRLMDATDVTFSVANPLYIQQTNHRTYVFHHGHHVRWDVHRLWSFFKLGDWINADRKVLGSELEFGSPSPGKAKKLEDFENGTFPFVTSFWRNGQDTDVPREDRVYAWLHNLSRPFVKGRKVKVGARKYDLARMPLEDFGRDVICEHYFPALLASQLLTLPAGKPVSFVYGDTHEVGYHDTAIEGRKVGIFNTGGWISYHRNVHPATAVYVVEESRGEESESLWEIGFPTKHLESMVDKIGEVLGPKCLGSFERSMFERLYRR